MCGRNTKHACYRFRVFGLPSNKQERIEKIKSGAKLFLFDFEVKLLYGVYEATSTGIINLEPLAFGGKFPAQVNQFAVSYLKFCPLLDFLMHDDCKKWVWGSM